jgi:3-phosphoshikimate 1-carboxyvinyltransferase
LTIEVMRSFGAEVQTHDTDGRLERIEVAPRRYAPCDFSVEPDASSASYFFALAAATGGRVRVDGLGSNSLQGDLGFTTVLASMGAEVRCVTDHTEVQGTGRLAGVEVDMVDISDTAPTLAAIAPLAASPTTVTGIGFARGKETDRIAAVVAELSRLGIAAAETSDGFVVSPGRITPGVVRTYDDHRMAMSFAVLGLASGGVSIADPGCVAKTFPGFWTAVDRLRAASS